MVVNLKKLTLDFFDSLIIVGVLEYKWGMFWNNWWERLIFLLKQCFSSDMKSTQFNLGKRNKLYILLYNQISVIILNIESIVKEWSENLLGSTYCY